MAEKEGSIAMKSSDPAHLTPKRTSVFPNNLNAAIGSATSLPSQMLGDGIEDRENQNLSFQQQAQALSQTMKQARHRLASFKIVSKKNTSVFPDRTRKSFPTQEEPDSEESSSIMPDKKGRENLFWWDQQDLLSEEKDIPFSRARKVQFKSPLFAVMEEEELKQLPHQGLQDILPETQDYLPEAQGDLLETQGDLTGVQSIELEAQSTEPDTQAPELEGQAVEPKAQATEPEVLVVKTETHGIILEAMSTELEDGSIMLDVQDFLPPNQAFLPKDQNVLPKCQDQDFLPKDQDFLPREQNILLKCQDQDSLPRYQTLYSRQQPSVGTTEKWRDLLLDGNQHPLPEHRREASSRRQVCDEYQSGLNTEFLTPLALQSGVDQEEDKKERQKQYLRYRRLFMDIEREQVKEQQRQKEHRKKIEKIKKKKEQQRYAEEQRMLRMNVHEEPYSGEKMSEMLAQLQLEEIKGAREKQRQREREYQRYVEALRAQIQEKMQLCNITLPPLCYCGPDFWDAHPDTCANNCIFYKNHRAYTRALHSVINSCDIPEGNSTLRSAIHNFASAHRRTLKNV
ncbi:coiled-coil domain containing 15 [Rhinolophus ferrumequinum]|uniref:Coiled-coil domain containing 15 n=1 Tax=Rhinolophus ferrumequinum TaxID=59479 RepID=A0A7J7RNH4_RHIFE|nr:coiled-coil domain containing 15 [Rhinolophus ferrumequinum]